MVQRSTTDPCRLGLCRRRAAAVLAGSLVILIATLPATSRAVLPVSPFISLLQGPAYAADEAGQRFEIRTGGTLRLDIPAGQIRIAGQARSDALVVFEDRDEIEENLDVVIESDGGDVAIKVDKKRRLRFWNDDEHIELSVFLPTGSNVIVDLGAGETQISDIAGNVTVSLGAGSVDAENIGGDIKADLGAGEINLTDVAGNIIADNATGETNIRNAQGHVEADVAIGALIVAFAPGNADGGSLEVATGDVELYIDHSLGFDIDASVGLGDISLAGQFDYAGQRSSTELQGTVGGGGGRIDIDVGLGSVMISPLPGASF